MTFQECCEIEPRLAELLALASSFKPAADEPFCANAVWYGHHRRGLKAALCQLVGWDANCDPRLRTSSVYGLCYDTIYAALPDCNGCACMMG
jgi:hypothetical protein